MRYGSEHGIRNLFIEYCTTWHFTLLKQTISLLLSILTGNLLYSETNGNAGQTQWLQVGWGFLFKGYC